MIEIKYVTTGEYGTNCYLLKDPATGLFAAVDCPGVTREYEGFLEENGVEKLEYIIFTHGHFDHTTGAGALKAKYGGKIAIHEEDEGCLYDEKKSLNSECHFPGFIPVKADILLRGGETIPFGESELTVIHAPGHTPGGILITCGDIMLCGDTLFKCSMGRTDLPGGSTLKLFATLRAVGAMEGEYEIYPGHGEFTTLAYEKENNRYLRQRK